MTEKERSRYGPFIILGVMAACLLLAIFASISIVFIAAWYASLSLLAWQAGNTKHHSILFLFVFVLIDLGIFSWLANVPVNGCINYLYPGGIFHQDLCLSLAEAKWLSKASPTLLGGTCLVGGIAYFLSYKHYKNKLH